MGDSLSMMAMAAMNDHTEEDLIMDTRRIMKQISDRYRIAFLWQLLKETRREVAGNNEKGHELLQRKWLSFNRPLRKGKLHVLGLNKGHRKWRVRYCVLQPDYTLEIYESEESYNHSVPPLYAHKHASHEVVPNVDVYLKQLCETAAKEFGYVNFDIPSMVKKLGKIGDISARPTPHAIGLYHAYRNPLYFAAESEIEKDLWLQSFRDTARHLAGVLGPTELCREAFAFAIEQTFYTHNFCDTKVTLSGEQEDIIADYTADYMANDCKTVLLPKMKGGLPFKFKMWDMISRKVFGLAKGVVDKEYPKMKEQIQNECNDLRPEFTTLIPQINQICDSITESVNDSLAFHMNNVLEDKVFPKLPNVLISMADAMLLLMREVHETFLRLVDEVNKHAQRSSVFANNIDQHFISTLDSATRNPDTMVEAFEIATGTKSAIALLNDIFSESDFSAQCSSICVTLQKHLDLAVYTFEKLCGDAVVRDNGHLHVTAITKAAGRVGKKLEYDLIVTSKEFVQELVEVVAMEMCSDKIDMIAKENMDDFTDQIPTNLTKYFSIHNLYLDIVCDMLKAKIKPVMSIANKRITLEHTGMAKSISNSTINSCHDTPLKHETVAKQESGTSSGEQTTDENIETDEFGEKIEKITTVEIEDPCPGGVMDGETGECLQEDSSSSDSHSQPSSHDGDEKNNNLDNCEAECDQPRHCDSEIEIAEREIVKCADLTERIIHTGEEKLI